MMAQDCRSAANGHPSGARLPKDGALGTTLVRRFLRGRVYLLNGPRGGGKSLLARQLGRFGKLSTRPSRADDTDVVIVSQRVFDAAKTQECFFHYPAHGYEYGLDLDALDASVDANGHLALIITVPPAMRRLVHLYAPGRVVPCFVWTPAELIRKRLATKFSPAEIDERTAPNPEIVREFLADPTLYEHVLINDATPEALAASARALVELDARRAQLSTEATV